MDIFTYQEQIRNQYNLEGQGFILQKVLFSFLLSDAVFDSLRIGQNSIDQRKELTELQVYSLTIFTTQIVQNALTEIERAKLEDQFKTDEDRAVQAQQAETSMDDLNQRMRYDMERLGIKWEQYEL